MPLGHLLSLLLLPKCSSDLLQHCSCPTARDWGSHITGLVTIDTLNFIQAVNNLYVDGRTLKASLGTTKYCSSFLNSPQCPKPVTCPRADCMYLHELGDEEASFTKEEMQVQILPIYYVLIAL